MDTNVDPRSGSNNKNIRVLIIFIFLLVATAVVVFDSYSYLKIDNARVTADMVTVRSDIDGIINKANIKLKSQYVNSGEVIVILNNTEVKNKLDIIEASLLEIESQINYNTQSYQVETAEVVDKKRKFELETLLLNKELERLIIKSDALAQTQQQIEDLFNEHLVASNVRDEAVSDFRLSYLDVEKQKVKIKKHQITQSQLITQQKKAQLIRHQISGDKNSKLKVQAQKALLETELAKLMKTAPFKGVVDHVFVHDGEFVTVGQRLFMMHSLESLRVEANILETDLAKVNLGDEVDVILDYMPDQILKGTIGRIASVTNDQLAFMPATQMASDFVKIKQRMVVDIFVKLPLDQIAPGMMATVIVPI